MTQQATAIGSGAIIVQITGDGNGVDLGMPRLCLIPFHNLNRAPRKALDVIDAFTTQLPLVGREAEMADFTTWLNDPQPIGVRCVAGMAGSGKSRLGIELCTQAAASGWFAGFVSHKELERFRAQDNLAAWGWSKPTLIVSDYAAAKARPIKDWLEELATHFRPSPHPLRLLLLEREARRDDGWWAELTRPSSAGAQYGLDGMMGDATPLILPGLESADQRRALVRAVMAAAAPWMETAVAAELPAVGANPAFDARIAGAGNPLDLAMIGLLAVYEGVGGVLTATRRTWRPNWHPSNAAAWIISPVTANLIRRRSTALPPWSPWPAPVPRTS